MRCSIARVMISARQDGELDPGRAAVLGKHLETCSACRREAAEISWLIEMMPVAGPSALSPGFLPALRRRIDELEERRAADRFYRVRGPARVFGAACAALLLFFAAYAGGLRFADGPGHYAPGPENIEEAFRSVLNLSLLDELPSESLDYRYHEFFQPDSRQ